MINQRLLEYVRRQLRQGIAEEEIKNTLLSQGWRQKDIDEIFRLVSDSSEGARQSSTFSQEADSSLPDAVAIFGRAWSVYLQKIGVLSGIMIMPMLITTILLAALSGIELPGVEFFWSKLATAGVAWLIFWVFLFFAIIAAVQSWGQIALIYAIENSRENIGVWESYRESCCKLFSYWWISLLTGLMVLGGLLLLIVPGVIFAVWFSLAPFVLMIENLKGMSALSKSKEYVKGKWGGVFWRFLFIGGVSWVISVILTFILTFLEIPFGEEIGQFALGLFLTPLGMVYSFLIYDYLKAAKG